MWVIGHRGARGLFPENTLTGFCQAVALGVDSIECDIRMSLDGELVVIHDATLERTGGTPERVDQLTVAALKGIDVGGGERAPILSEVLDAVGIPVLVEIKTGNCVPALAELLIHNPPWIERVVPISFDHRVIKALREEIPVLEAGIILAGVPVNVMAVIQAAEVSRVSINHEWVDPALVESLHQAHIAVTVWTVNTPAEIESAIANGVDGITTDYPDRVLRVCGRA